MKHDRRLTVKQKEILEELGINPGQYFRVKALPNELHIVHKKVRKTRILKKGKDGKWYESYRCC